LLIETFYTEILKNRLPLGSGQLPQAIVRISVSKNPNKHKDFLIQKIKNKNLF
jgi:hypothetical protein